MTPAKRSGARRGAEKSGLMRYSDLGHSGSEERFIMPLLELPFSGLKFLKSMSTNRRIWSVFIACKDIEDRNPQCKRPPTISWTSRL